MKKVLALGLILGCAAFAVAGQPTLTFHRTIDYTPHDVIGNCYAACAHAGGGILFGDGYEDRIIQVINPLVSDGATNDWVNSTGVYQMTFTAGSIQGVTGYNGVYYASGVDGTVSNLSRFSESLIGMGYSGVKLTVTPDGPYSGVTAVGQSTLVMANYDTGALQFFTVVGETATASGSEVANPNAAGFKTTQVVYYDSGSVKKIFAYMVADNKTRRIDVFDTDATAAGTTYAGTFCAALNGNFVVAGAKGTQFSGMAVDPVNQVLVASVNLDTAGTNGFDVFNLNTISTTGTAMPYLQLRDAAFNNASGTNRLTCGGAFFTYAGNSYLALTSANRVNVYTVTQVAAAGDWSLYK